MSVIYTFMCDGCGREGQGVCGAYMFLDPPTGWTWFYGSELAVTGPHACSAECWEKVKRSPDGRLYLSDSHEMREARVSRVVESAPEPSACREVTRGGERVVYFIRRGDDGPIKIGFSINPEMRRSQLQCGIPERLHILGVMPGGKAEESRLHRLFSAACISGEWFNPVPELLEYIHQNARAA